MRVGYGIPMHIQFKLDDQYRERLGDRPNIKAKEILLAALSGETRRDERARSKGSGNSVSPESVPGVQKGTNGLKSRRPTIGETWAR